MKSVGRNKHTVIPVLLCLASGLLLFMASPVPRSASAQSARPARLTGALLGLHHEFPETLHKITPELLSLQEQLVNELRIQLAGTREEERVGQRTLEDVINITAYYFQELETLQVMTARSKKKSITEREILKIRIAVRSEVLLQLKRDIEATKARYGAGEVYRTDVARAKARALKAEIMLEALKGAAGK